MKKIGLIALACILLLPIGLTVFLGGEDEPPETTNAGSFISAVPSQYLDDVNKAGGICPEVTPSIIAAQIHAESGWNPNALSPAGAQGIAQFMPGTWASNGMDGDGDGTADVLNAHDAIWSQGNLMCSNVDSVKALIDKGLLSGDVLDLALAGYNAGMGNVQTHRGIPPFTETQNYIKTIRELATTTYAPGNAVLASESSTALLDWAKTQEGKGYCSAGRGPLCYDCCGLVAEAIENTTGKPAPMSIPGNPWATSKCEFALYERAAEYGGTQFTFTNESELQPGDIVFYQEAGVAASVDYVTQVAIRAGNGQNTDAANPALGVGTRPNWDGMLNMAVRIGESK